LVPNLSALAFTPKPRTDLTPDAPDGRYCLDLPDDTIQCDSSVVVLRNALPFTDEQTQELRTFILDETKVPKTPNPMNANYYVKRRQTTFGALYSFGQKMASQGPDQRWPQAVTDALQFAQQFAEARGIAKELYNGVHANFYPDGSSGVAPHSDAEGDMLRGMPIISMTLLSGDKKPRPFSIYEKPAKKGEKPLKIADVVLGHGDVIVMMGRMQESFLHGVEAAKPPKEFKNAERMNLTVRAFTPDAVSYAGQKRPRESV
tara:strand:+ start:1361 stop:2140 length:780 start_codon:yes stop_codon:yes gene_type:complete